MIKKIAKSLSKLITSAALICAIVNVNSACSWAVYQPKEPDGLKKFSIWNKQ